jgi:hypothetical protein
MMKKWGGGGGLRKVLKRNVTRFYFLPKHLYPLPEKYYQVAKIPEKDCSLVVVVSLSKIIHGSRQTTSPTRW